MSDQVKDLIHCSNKLRQLRIRTVRVIVLYLLKEAFCLFGLACLLKYRGNIIEKFRQTRMAGIIINNPVNRNLGLFILTFPDKRKCFIA